MKKLVFGYYFIWCANGKSEKKFVLIFFYCEGKNELVKKKFVFDYFFFTAQRRKIELITELITG
jgi:hypothetical protein